MGGWRRRNLILMIVAAVGAGLVIPWLWGNRTRVEVLSIDRWEPDVLSVMVDSCNGAPEADVVELGDGRYEVEARTTRAYDAGNDCGDVVEIPVDPDLDSFEVVDRVSGETFVVPSVPLEEPVDVDGKWRMVEVNSEPVQVGINTAVVPEVTIRAGFLRGNFGCNGAGAELLQEGDVMHPSPGEGDGALCDSPDEPGVMVATERTLTGLLRSGFEIERSPNGMTWSGAPGRVVFELVAE